MNVAGVCCRFALSSTVVSDDIETMAKALERPARKLPGIGKVSSVLGSDPD